MYAALRNHLYNWLFQIRGPHVGPIVLVQRRVFILPTRHGLLFAGVLLLMLVGSINYALSLGFVLTFLLVGLGLNAMIYTFRNLARLSVSGGRVQPVFVGDTASFPVHLENPGHISRHAIGLTDEWHGHLRPGYSLEGIRQVLGPRFEIEQAVTYSKAFSELVDTGLNGLYLAMQRGSTRR